MREKRFLDTALRKESGERTDPEHDENERNDEATGVQPGHRPSDDDRGKGESVPRLVALPDLPAGHVPQNRADRRANIRDQTKAGKYESEACQDIVSADETLSVVSSRRRCSRYRHGVRIVNTQRHRRLRRYRRCRW